MSTILHLLVPVDSITAERLERVGELLRVRGLRPAGHLPGLADADGSVVISKDAGDELTLSVHRRRDTLRELMRASPDRPRYDELVLDLSTGAQALWGAAWRFVERDAVALAAAVDATWLWGAEPGEAGVVHRAVIAGDLPDVAATLEAAPTGSVLAAALERRTRCTHESGYTVRRR